MEYLFEDYLSEPVTLFAKHLTHEINKAIVNNKSQIKITYTKYPGISMVLYHDMMFIYQLLESYYFNKLYIGINILNDEDNCSHVSIYYLATGKYGYIFDINNKKDEAFNEMSKLLFDRCIKSLGNGSTQKEQKISLMDITLPTYQQDYLCYSVSEKLKPTGWQIKKRMGYYYLSKCSKN